MYYLIGYDRCSTCIKAMKHLKEKGINYTFYDVKKNPPTIEMFEFLISSIENRDLLWNTSGKLYREMDIKNKKSVYTDEEMAKLLSSEGMLVKRPILYKEKQIIIGYKKEIYDNL